MVYPSTLTDIQDFVAQQGYQMTPSVPSNKRLDSLVLGETIIKDITTSFRNVHPAPHSRYWYDFIVEDGSSVYPVNLKVTSGLNKDTADNAGQYIGMIWAFSNLPDDDVFEFGCQPRHKTKLVNDILINRYGETSRDYFYLVVDKHLPHNTLLTSIKTMTVSSSKSGKHNLPFQANWKGSKRPRPHSNKQAYSYIMNAYKTNVALSIADHTELMKNAF